MKTIITAIVVSVVISGTASAGVTTLITSRQIKDHTIQMRDISPSAVGQLKGQSGAQGVAGAKGDTGAPGPQGPKGEPGESNGLYVRTVTATIPDVSEGGGNPTNIELRCEPGDHIVSDSPWGFDPPRETWSSAWNLRQDDATALWSDEVISTDFTWHGGVGTSLTLTQRVICSS